MIQTLLPPNSFQTFGWPLKFHCVLYWLQPLEAHIGFPIQRPPGLTCWCSYGRFIVLTIPFLKCQPYVTICLHFYIGLVSLSHSQVIAQSHVLVTYTCYLDHVLFKWFQHLLYWHVYTACIPSDSALQLFSVVNIISLTFHNSGTLSVVYSPGYFPMYSSK